MRHKPDNDNEYFEDMSRVVMFAGLKWSTMMGKWPEMKAALADLDPERVAGFGSSEIDTLMQNTAVIRNRTKLEAVASNAREFLAVQDQFGSFKAYLKGLQDSGGEKALFADIQKRFKFMGKGTTFLFLRSIGMELPEAAKDWEARQNKVECK